MGEEYEDGDQLSAPRSILNALIIVAVFYAAVFLLAWGLFLLRAR